MFEDSILLERCKLLMQGERVTSTVVCCRRHFFEIILNLRFAHSITMRWNGENEAAKERSVKAKEIH